MPWRYQQSTGELTFKGRMIGKGYSGRKGEARNNPDMEDVRNKGPIPTGSYRIGPMYDSEKRGPHVMRLDPRGHGALGRTDFLIHGDNKTGDASEGCIILNRALRDRIAASDDKLLEVVR